MTKLTAQVLYKGTHYAACVMRDGSLVVTSNRKQRGVRLTGVAAKTWVLEIATATTDEAHALCSALLNT